MLHTFLDAPLPIAFAHRGGASEAPENTLPAFEHAVRLGYTHIETDVHATADGVLLAFHDDRLDRVTDLSGVISQMTYAEVAKARVDGREPIPRFEELLATWPDLRINIDAKHDTAVGPLVALLRAHDAFDRTCIGSFSDQRLRGLRQEFGARLCTSAGPRETIQLMLGIRPAGVNCAQVPVRKGPVRIVSQRFIERCHRRSMQVPASTRQSEIR